MKKLLPRILLLLFVAAQVYFVVAIIKEKPLKSWFVIAFSLVVLGMFLSYRKRHRLHISQKNDFHFVIFIWFLIGSCTTYFLQSQLGFNTVLSAGLVGFVGSFTRNLNKKFESASHWPIVIYCGAFIGMTQLPYGYVFIFLATFLTGIFYSFSQHYFHGIGGKLGTLAFMGVFYAYLIYKLILP
ncbi:hypothetical protein G6R40_09315 [Chryseobacterium sp. POL2]|uniref:hypothetical protein n=1 Tax=Chryseobacterium sp. POL2 TaxID=2713414 RepID=UPI0013E1513D|nr:hypothetical protein [Chryseobacterium sp. POL2]QIG89849.1 hypothetical protein G6R40_09315 [Chryseobacterium sp. POL2]